MVKILVMKIKKNSAKFEISQLLQLMVDKGLEANIVNYFGEYIIIAEVKSGIPTSWLSNLTEIVDIIWTKSTFPLASLDVKTTSTIVSISPNVQVGGKDIIVIAGPCAVENRDQFLTTAESVKASGAKALRGGIYKPRTSPYTFQGLGNKGIPLLVEIQSLTGLPIVTEVITPEDIDQLLPYVDVFQVGARNMQNFSLLRTLSRINKPILLKRGMAATIDEWLQAAEYILAGGNSNIILCERGIRCFQQRTRNVLDISAVPLIKSLSHLPIIVDPSHGTGCRSLVLSMSLAAIAAGADGLIIEVHPNPEKALSDGEQSLSLTEFAALMESVRQLTMVLSHRISSQDRDIMI